MDQIIRAVQWTYCILATSFSLLLLLIPSKSTYILSGVNLILVFVVYFQFLNKKKTIVSTYDHQTLARSDVNAVEATPSSNKTPVVQSAFIEASPSKIVIEANKKTATVEEHISSNPHTIAPTANTIEQRIQGEIITNPTISNEKVLTKEKTPIAEPVRQNYEIELHGNTSPTTHSATSSKALEIIPHSKLIYSKGRKLTTDFVVLDFETTGLASSKDDIIQVAVIKYTNFEKVDEFQTYVKPKNPIPSNITKINNITNQDVQNAPPIQAVLPKLLAFIGEHTIIVHNASFEMKFLLSAMYHNDVEHKKFRVIDTLRLARKYIDVTKNHKLVTLKSFLKLNYLNPYDALHDCYVTAALYKYCYHESLIKQK